ncbi:OmpP1/FadL family transporter [Desulforhabdus amnigena]|jgi:long-chain fatty acid transport protein|uniref:Fatty acid transporter n=1 Tax=Desulforhabdus amnigena TaxID=40218 RepID=A0A9W6D1S0_9BACT|nr:outer membrane protein transport protein [Desulforhabdus amnigena]NLJ27672.1 hypothetical protein [Deltaproteobacteria bacterium]GLI33038.1 fatty acid transporter [Desulforhabdus amnigena]
MKRVFRTLATICLIVMLPGLSVAAVNGNQLIGIGPVARSMGGVGVAYPMDAISAVFSNPAAMCFGLYCPGSQADFAVSFLVPDIQSKVTGPGVGGTIEANANNNVFEIPAIGVSIPLNKAMPLWRLGLAAYGVSGLGADFRGTALDQPNFFAPEVPLIAGEYTNLQTVKTAPAIAFEPSDCLSFGLAFHLDYETLDLRHGSSYDFGWGVQLGTLYKPTDNISLGLTYISPQNVTHDNVVDIDHDGNLDSQKVQAPQQIGFGAAYHVQADKLVVEGDVKWLNWANANGYDDLDYDNQWVFALGLQYKPISKVALRAGYNYGKSPLDGHHGFNGTGISKLEGHSLPTYYYETYRTIGFATILEHQLTFGASYELTPNLVVNIGYEHSFQNTLTSTGTDLTGQPVTLQTEVSGNTFDTGIIFRF